MRFAVGTISLTLLLSAVPYGLPTAAVAQATEEPDAPLSESAYSCQQALMRVSHRYLTRNLKIRHRCRARASAAAACLTGLGDDKTAKAIAKLRDRVDTAVLRTCRNVNLNDLYFPGPCDLITTGTCHIDQCTDSYRECRDTLESGDAVAPPDCAAGQCIERNMYVGCTTHADCRGEAGTCKTPGQVCEGGPFAGRTCQADADCASSAECKDKTVGVFDVTDLSTCFKSLLDTNSEILLDQEYPADSSTGATARARQGRKGKTKKKGCVERAATAASRMVLRELRTRQRCLSDERAPDTGEEAADAGEDTAEEATGCRKNVVPYGPGTGNTRADAIIVQAYVRLLLLVPSVCEDSDLAGKTYTSFDPTGAPFDVYDLRQFLFDTHRSLNRDLLSVAFPPKPVCGDGELQGWVEECDDGNIFSDDTCLPNCAAARCGDDQVCSHTSCESGPSSGAEECDDGALNSDTVSDACRTDCASPFCGDGVVDSGAGEACDSGAANSDTAADACRTTCALATCGDGVVDSSEACDIGRQCRDADGVPGSLCTTDDDCAAGQTCEPGGESATCDSDCTLALDRAPAEVSVTGSGVFNSITLTWDLSVVGKAAAVVAEDKDGNPVCAVSTQLAAQGCLYSLGNYLSGSELTATVDGCDIALDEAAPLVLFTCLTVVGEAGAEPGGDVTVDDVVCSEDGCGETAADITVSMEVLEADSCGDGTVNYARGEACDDGNLSDNDACLSDCALAHCGDGHVCSDGACSPAEGGPGEELCDDGNDDEEDGCLSTCRTVACGNGTVDPGEDCDDGNTVESDACLNNCMEAACGDGIIYAGVEECDGESVGDCEFCSDQCRCFIGRGCPGSGELTLYAGTGVSCAGDQDCFDFYGEQYPGSCNPELSRCTTKTLLTTGSTGIAHGADLTDNISLKGRLQCPDAAPCGDCAVIGLMADNPDEGEQGGRYCRCAADNRQYCDVPLDSDPDACGGYEDDFCNCYLGPPLSFSAGNTPACVVNRIAQDTKGTAWVDEGRGEVEAHLRSVAHLGEGLTEPCPYCVGDVTPSDGLRDGVCRKGANQGETCDGWGVNTSFPGPYGIATSCIGGPKDGDGCMIDSNCDEEGGDGLGVCGNPVPAYPSLDCMPSAGKNVSGEGLQIDLIQRTERVELAASLACGFPFFGHNCHCRQCTGDSTVPCSDDSMCEEVGGTCSSLGSGTNVGPNGCDGYLCSDVDGQGTVGECTTGPDSRFCDGMLKSSGDPFVACQADADCSISVIGFDAGSCTMVKRRSCFLDPIVAVGEASTTAPLGAAIFCIPPTGNAGINGVAGLPGVGRAMNHASGKLFCASDPGKRYEPGLGGCD